jgi:hypothetical protein
MEAKPTAVVHSGLDRPHFGRRAARVALGNDGTAASSVDERNRLWTSLLQPGLQRRFSFEKLLCIRRRGDALGHNI